MSEAPLFAEHVENMLCTKIVLNVRNNFCIQHVLHRPRFELVIFMYWTCDSMNNLSSYCGLVDAKIRAFDKDLPVCTILSCQLFWATFGELSNLSVLRIHFTWALASILRHNIFKVCYYLFSEFSSSVSSIISTK